MKKISSNVVLPIITIVMVSLIFQISSISALSDHISPRKQVENGVLPQDVTCQSGMYLVFKTKGSLPVCVKQETQAKLVERGWASTSWTSITNPNNVAIKLERTACFGTCPIYSVTVYGNGTVYYEGVRFVQTNGTKTYDVPADQVEKLVALINEIDYFSLSDRYDAHVTDLPSAITTITMGDKIKSVTNYGNAGPQKLENLQQKIDEIAGSQKLIGSHTPQFPAEPEPTSITEAANLDNLFAFDMYSNLAQGKQENMFFSPYSISSAFSILYEGAKGTTQDEIQSVFHFIKDDNSRRNYTHTIISDLNKPAPNYILSSANALWVQDDFPILPEYKDIANTYYLAKTENLDFKTHIEESRNTINSWVENKTNEKIKDLLPQGSLNEMTRAVITNAVYFLGNWTTQFDGNLTKQDDFKISENDTVKVPMMNTKQHFNYFSNNDLQILQMSYKGNDLSMLVLLPKNNDIQSLEKNLSAENLNQWKTSLTNNEVNVFLPKFKLETSYSLVGNLSEMGMPSSFDANVADFSGIDGKQDLYVTGVFHKAFVAVDEKGTEAAAATGIVVGLTSMPAEPIVFKADHPFIFLIQDDRTGLILFMGKVVDPTKAQ